MQAERRFAEEARWKQEEGQRKRDEDKRRQEEEVSGAWRRVDE
jgi:hypothetical protein